LGKGKPSELAEGDRVIEVQAKIVGAETLIANLREMSASSRQRVASTVHALGLETLARVKADYLSGQALKVRTGRLRRSINEKFTESGATFTSSVGTNVSYGRFWELGFHGLEEVKQHMRMITMAWGKPVANPHEVTVRAHQRKVNQAPRPFLQPALEQMKNEIRARLVSAIEGRA
jgi:phage gpG-like protein